MFMLSVAFLLEGKYSGSPLAGCHGIAQPSPLFLLVQVRYLHGQSSVLAQVDMYVREKVDIYCVIRTNARRIKY